MKSDRPRKKRISIEEGVYVHEWLKANADFVENALPNYERICQRIEVDTQIAVAKTMLKSLWDIRLVPMTSQKVESTIVEHLLKALEHLYDQLGEQHHEGLTSARRLIS